MKCCYHLENVASSWLLESLGYVGSLGDRGSHGVVSSDDGSLSDGAELSISPWKVPFEYWLFYSYLPTQSAARTRRDCIVIVIWKPKPIDSHLYEGNWFVWTTVSWTMAVAKRRTCSSTWSCGDFPTCACSSGTVQTISWQTSQVGEDEGEKKRRSWRADGFCSFNPETLYQFGTLTSGNFSHVIPCRVPAEYGSSPLLIFWKRRAPISVPLVPTSC